MTRRIPDALVSRGACWCGKEEWNRATTDFGLAFRLDPHDPTLPMLPRGMWQLVNKPDEALADLDAAIRLDPDLADSHAEKARILAEKREFGKASAAYEIAIRIDPERADYYV